MFQICDSCTKLHLEITAYYFDLSMIFSVFEICDQLYKAALGNCFEAEEWGPFEFCVMAKHFERQGKSPYAYHAV